jgi:pseudouridine kinase
MTGKNMRTNDILCIGGINIDWATISPENYYPVDSFPFVFTPAVGGVIYNVASNLTDLEHDIHLISAVGDDPHHEMILKALHEKKIARQNILTRKGEQTASIVFMIGNNGELLHHIERTQIYERFTPYDLKPLQAEMDASKTWIIDTDLSADTLSYIAHRVPETSKLFGVISTPEKADRIVSILAHFEGLFLNLDELNCLTKCTINTKDEILAASDWLREQGITYVFITLGPDGVCVNTPEYKGIMPALTADVQDTQGAGDAFASTVIDAFTRGNYSMIDIVSRGLAASSLAVEVKKRTNGMLSHALINERMQNI